MYLPKSKAFKQLTKYVKYTYKPNMSDISVPLKAYIS